MNIDNNKPHNYIKCPLCSEQVTPTDITCTNCEENLVTAYKEETEHKKFFRLFLVFLMICFIAAILLNWNINSGLPGQTANILIEISKKRGIAFILFWLSILGIIITGVFYYLYKIKKWIAEGKNPILKIFSTIFYIILALFLIWLDIKIL